MQKKNLYLNTKKTTTNSTIPHITKTLATTKQSTMKNLSSCAFFFIIITAFTLLSHCLCDKQTQDLINQICRQTSDFAFCNNILERNLVSPKTDLAGLTRLTTSLSRSYAGDTLSFIQKSEAAETNPSVKQLYAGCDSNYQKVVGFMDGAKSAANRGDYRSMVTQLQSCSRPIIECQSAIARVVPQMLQKNRLMRVLLSMGLYEGTLLQNHHHLHSI